MKKRKTRRGKDAMRSLRPPQGSGKPYHNSRTPAPKWVRLKEVGETARGDDGEQRATGGDLTVQKDTTKQMEEVTKKMEEATANLEEAKAGTVQNRQKWICRTREANMTKKKLWPKVCSFRTKLIRAGLQQLWRRFVEYAIVVKVNEATSRGNRHRSYIEMRVSMVKKSTAKRMTRSLKRYSRKNKSGLLVPLCVAAVAGE